MGIEQGAVGSIRILLGFSMDKQQMYVPHPVVGAILENPKQGVVLLDEKK